MKLREGTTLLDGRFTIIKVLGQGGFGITYLARNEMLDKIVAIKEFFPNDFCGRDETSHVTVGTENQRDTVEKLKERFLKEAKNLAKLEHPGIVMINQIFEDNNTAYYVMGYVEGESLSDIVKKHGPLDEDEAIGFISKIAKALEYVHSMQMTHFDIKPANIMVRKVDNEPILIDFGLSKQYDYQGNATSTMMQAVSPGYSAIELYNVSSLKEFSPQSDIYSLGATLYYLLTGKHPPVASDLIGESLHFPENISMPMRKAIEKAMDINRAKRPQTIGEFMALINSTDVDDDEGEKTVMLPQGLSENDEYANNAEASSEEEYPSEGDYSEEGSYTPDSMETADESFETEKSNGNKKLVVWILAAVLVIALIILISKCSSDDTSSQIPYGNEQVSEETPVEQTVTAPDDEEKKEDVKATDETEVKREDEKGTSDAKEERNDVKERVNEVPAVAAKEEPQEVVEPPRPKVDEIFQAVEQPAEFIGGQAALNKWLSQNIRYPESAQKNGVTGRVVVRFVVEKDGSISGVSVLKGVDKDLDAEAMRVVKRMPKWQAGKNNGQTVRSYFTIPVTFKLQTQ